MVLWIAGGEESAHGPQQPPHRLVVDKWGAPADSGGRERMHGSGHKGAHADAHCDARLEVRGSGKGALGAHTLELRCPFASRWGQRELLMGSGELGRMFVLK